MNAASGFPPNRNRVRIKYRALFLEAVPCSGERLAIGVVADDGERRHVEAANRWNEAISALNKKSTILADLTDEIIRFYKEHPVCLKRALCELHAPFNSVFFGEERITAGHNIADALQNALRLTTAFHTAVNARAAAHDVVAVPTELPLTPTSERKRGRLIKLVEEEAARHDPELRAYFNRPLSSGDKRVQPSIGFLSSFLAADFVSMNPKRIRFCARNARSYMQTLMLASKQPEVRKDTPRVLYMHRPSDQDPMWDEGDLGLVNEACGELSREAEQLEIVPRIQDDVPSIVSELVVYASAGGKAPPRLGA